MQVQFLTQAIHGMLQILFQLTGSYGTAILLLTVGIRVLLLPLSILGQRSGRKSAALQAEVKAIQAQYPVEEAKRRVQELSGRAGSAMLAGCLPVLAQWPILLAMYSALSSFPLAVPAGFLWLKDLALPDPYFILPLLVIGTQVWQSLATLPKEQRAMAFILPVMIGFFLVKASAAVVLYWAASNLVSLTQHYLFRRREALA